MVGRGAPEPIRSGRAGKTLLARQAHRSENPPCFSCGERQTEKDYEPAENCNTMTVEEAIFSLSLNHTGKQILENLAFCGLIKPLEEIREDVE